MGRKTNVSNHRPKLDRWVGAGRVVDSGRAQWGDTHAADDFYWKCNPHLVFEPTSSATNVYYAALDYLYAYWVMRFYHLDRHPAIVKQNLGVLQPTPGAALNLPGTLNLEPETPFP